jgi:anaerobic selenocysteine-containing dehydrogenase
MAAKTIQIPILTGITDLRLSEALPQAQWQRKLCRNRSLIAKLSDANPAAHTPSLRAAILHNNPYAINSLLVFSANPVGPEANVRKVEAVLEILDLLVVVDLFMTQTAKPADIVLPACSSLDRSHFGINDSHSDNGWIFSCRAVLSPKAGEPLHESWSYW